MGNLANNEFDSAESLVQYMWASEGVMSGVCLNNNHFSMDQLNSLLRVCYNHEGYPQKTADGKGFAPLRVEISGNPCAGERTLKELLDSVYQEGGVFFSTDEAFPTATNGPLLPVTDLLYLVVHLPRTGVNWKPVVQSENNNSSHHNSSRRTKERNKDKEGDHNNGSSDNIGLGRDGAGRDGNRGSGKKSSKDKESERDRDRGDRKEAHRERSRDRERTA